MRPDAEPQSTSKNLFRVRPIALRLLVGAGLLVAFAEVSNILVNYTDNNPQNNLRPTPVGRFGNLQRQHWLQDVNPTPQPTEQNLQ